MIRRNSPVRLRLATDFRLLVRTGQDYELLFAFRVPDRFDSIDRLETFDIFIIERPG